jgi:hypothetical protein
MIIGGLGNQLFQYAIGRHLSIIGKTSLKLDLTQLEERPSSNTYVVRSYELDRYNLKVQIAEKKDIAFFKSDNSLTSRVFIRIKKRLRMINLIKEDGFEFEPEIFSSRKNIYLDGYWQSEKYFYQINEKIRDEITLKEDLLAEINNSPGLRDVLIQIARTNSVAVHFRRGDYIRDPLLKKHYAECLPEYYNQAITLINTRTSLPRYFLFSDEPDWLKTTVYFREQGTIIENNPAFIDLYLMSICKHNIIANSSFSWWGAWLNNNPQKIVIAPQKWFADEEVNKQTKDLIPDKWIRI